MNSALVLVVVAWLGLCSVEVLGRPQHYRPLPADMEGDIKTLTVPLKLRDTDLVGRPVFLGLMGELDGKFEHEQWLLLNATLDVYLEIFSNMLKETLPEEVKLGLTSLSGNVEELKRHYYQDRVKMKIQELAAIKTTDAVVQRKAVNELNEVFQRAFQLGNILHQRAGDTTLRPDRSTN